MGFVSVVTTSGKIKGKGLKSLESGCYIALGRGVPSWDTTVNVTLPFVANVIELGTDIDSEVVKSSDNLTTYIRNVDYFINKITGTLTRINAGNIAPAETVNIEYKDIGRLPIDSTGLYDEIGRKKAFIDFVTQDNGGSIELSGIKYETSPTPTNLLYVRTTFTETELGSEQFREAGVFFDTELVGSAQAETLTFASSQVNLSFVLVRDVVVKSQDNLTTYNEGSDYVVDYTNGVIFRKASGNIPAAAEVNIDYKVDLEDYVEVADVADAGLFYGGSTFPVEEIAVSTTQQRTFLISITE
jgi:hypothetical protein